MTAPPLISDLVNSRQPLPVHTKTWEALTCITVLTTARFKPSPVSSAAETPALGWVRRPSQQQCGSHLTSHPLHAVPRHLILPAELQHLPHGCLGSCRAAPHTPSLCSSLCWGPLLLVLSQGKHILPMPEQKTAFLFMQEMNLLCQCYWSEA